MNVHRCSTTRPSWHTMHPSFLPFGSPAPRTMVLVSLWSIILCAQIQFQAFLLFKEKSFPSGITIMRTLELDFASHCLQAQVHNLQTVPAGICVQWKNPFKQTTDAAKILPLPCLDLRLYSYSAVSVNPSSNDLAYLTPTMSQGSLKVKFKTSSHPASTFVVMITPDENHRFRGYLMLENATSL